MSDDKKNEFPKKWFSKLPDGFVDLAESCQNDELETKIVEGTAIISSTEIDMENNEKLNILKEDVKALQGGYMDAIRAETAKVKYCMHVLKSRGVR